MTMYERGCCGKQRSCAERVGNCASKELRLGSYADVRRNYENSQ